MSSLHLSDEFDALQAIIQEHVENTESAYVMTALLKHIAALESRLAKLERFTGLALPEALEQEQGEDTPIPHIGGPAQTPLNELLETSAAFAASHGLMFISPAECKPGDQIYRYIAGLAAYQGEIISIEPGESGATRLVKVKREDGSMTREYVSSLHAWYILRPGRAALRENGGAL